MSDAPKGHDPILDEQGIIGLLRAPAIPDATPALQAGAVQTMLDLYDRGATREVFCEHGAACLGLYGQAAKLWMLNNIHEVFKSEEGLTEARFRDAQDGLADLIRKQAETLIDMVKRLQQCPTSEDNIH